MKKTHFIILATALLMCGCNAINLAYRNADWYLQHKISYYASFNDRQQETIRSEVAGYMRWHRARALPQYILFLQNLNRAVQQDGQLTAGDVTRLRAQLLSLYRITLIPALAPAAQLLGSLDGGQILELQRNLAEENREKMQALQKKNRDDYLDKREKQTLEFLHWLAGSMSDSQEQEIKAMSRNLPVVAGIYLQQRETHQDRLAAMLNDHAGAASIAAFLSEWLLTPETARSPQQQDIIQSYERASDEMIAQVHGMLNARQKGHINKLLAGYIDDMREASNLGTQEAAP